MVILERLQHVLQMEVGLRLLIITEQDHQNDILQGQIQSTSDRVQLNDLQSLLCATLQVFILSHI